MRFGRDIGGPRAVVLRGNLAGLHLQGDVLCIQPILYRDDGHGDLSRCGTMRHFERRMYIVEVFLHQLHA